MMIQPDEMSSEALHSEPVMERKEVLSSFEDAYRCIKEATGVTNIQVVAVLPCIHIWYFENASAPPHLHHLSQKCFRQILVLEEDERSKCKMRCFF